MAGFLADAVSLAEAGPGTFVWFALRTDDTTFWIVDAFPGATGRQAHLDGSIAAALMQNAERLLAAPPQSSPGRSMTTRIHGGVAPSDRATVPASRTAPAVVRADRSRPVGVPS